ncbi:MAG: TetR/AcrR family transcriptional regulator [Acidimicrobiales bacterium]
MASSGAATAGDMTPAERILERAIEVIEAGGEVAIRTNTIAEECGVTAPILYRAYTNREGLVVTAQAERYRRASAAAMDFLLDRIGRATGRDELRANIAETMDFIMSPDRARNRRLRSEVIGSAVSRPGLAAEVSRIDREYSVAIASAYAPAIERGWIPAGTDLAAVALWIQGMVNGRTQIEFGADDDVARAWNDLTRSAVLRAIFWD